MLFCIEESILDVLQDERVKDALSNLAMARKKGKHLIYASRKVLEELIRSSELDKFPRDVFLRLNSRSSKLKAYLNEFDRRIELVSDISIVQKYIDKDGKQVIKLPIYFLEELNLVTESMLILEDINDYKMYKYIVDYALAKRNLTDVKVNFNIIPGAGGGISKVFLEKIKDCKHLVISIADTDKTSPNESLGPTIRPLIRYYNRIKNKCLGEAFYSEYHEVENLIPQFCYEKLGLLTDSEIKSYIEVATTSLVKEELKIPIEWKVFQLNVYKLKRQDVFKYFDYKKGITLTNFKNIHGEEYWSKILSDIGVKFNIDDYKPIDDINKGTLVINGFNDNVLNTTFEILGETNLNLLDTLLSEELKILWVNIGDFLINWGCGGIPIRFL
ncbi:hypothetical protein [Desnuesiella massiliensis]|uniref:hypothetical protein n=1 Tax=Desnuesiella massiliensis TaxID=1650662 RepID=UPI0006E3CB82|nr:hypothetical protein [Desnuesiella massiliensis]